MPRSFSARLHVNLALKGPARSLLPIWVAQLDNLAARVAPIWTRRGGLDTPGGGRTRYGFA